MQSDDTQSSKSSSKDSSNKVNSQITPQNTTVARPQQHSYFTIPSPLKRLFDRFPLYTYPSNPLPTRPSTLHTRAQRTNTLYIFTDPTSPPNSLSPNPTCLRYQTLLHLAGIPFETVTANNHASPSGSLPFLIPSSDTGTIAHPIPAAGIKTFIRTHNAEADLDLEGEQLQLALLEPIRRAYLTALYLEDETFRDVCAPLYVNTTSTNTLIRAALIPPLRAAAFEEVVSDSNDAPVTSVEQWVRGWWGGQDGVDRDGIYADAEEAFGSLSVMLGDKRWFGRRDEREVSGWVDASVFAYTHTVVALFAGAGEHTGAMRLKRAVEQYENLMAHRERILEAFPG